MSRIHPNNFQTTLAATLDDTDTTITLTDNLPTIGAGNYVVLTVTDGTNFEMLSVNSNSGAPTYTIVDRALEGTTATTFASGKSVSIRITKESVDEKLAILDGLRLETKTADYSLVADDINKTIVMNNSTTAILTMPDPSTVTDGYNVSFFRTGSAEAGIDTAAGSIVSKNSYVYLNGQYSWAKILKLSSSVWGLYGDLKTDPPPPTVWDSADKDAGITLSNGDLTAAYSSGVPRPGVGSTTSKSSGAWYFEVVADAASSGSWFTVGISPKSGGRNVDIGQNANTYGYGKQGSKYFDASYGGIVWSSYTTGDVVGCAFDIDNNTIEFFKNNVSQGSVSVTLDAANYCATFCADASGQQATLQAASADLTYTPPVGFTPLGD